MKNKKNLCLLMTVMLLGTYNLTADNALADDMTVVNATADTATVEPDEIKANKETLEKARESVNRKDYQSAIVYLTAYISSKPKKYEPYKLRGEAFYALRQYKLAQQDFQTAIDIKTSDDKFITGTKVIGAVVLGADKQDQYQNPELGNLYGSLMYSQKALNLPIYETAYQKAFEYNSHIYLPKVKKEDIGKINCPQKYGKVLDPQGVDEYIYGAINDIESGNYSEAVYKTQYITANYPKYYLGYYLNGVALVGLEQEKEAIAAFDLALKYNPYDFESMASLGQIYYADAEKTFSPDYAKKSIEYFNKALKYNSNCYTYYYYIGLNYLQMGDYNLAITNFNNAIKYKSNDYNSMYYKLIAQYILGDYKAATEGATKLLYRHVSNYNSVLYLRALAQYKLGNDDEALADLEKIHNNMNDIYNADLKNLSPKEQTLGNYLYYLKAQILSKKDYGAKSDYLKAVQNPIIAVLTRTDNSINQFAVPLEKSAEIPENDFNNYKKLYNVQLNNLLSSNMVIPSSDVENQYDYIRTTFDNLGLTFTYNEPDYKFAVIENYLYKKFGSKLVQSSSPQVNPSVEKTVSVPDDKPVISENAQASKVVLKPVTDPSETLAAENQQSIARMLASQSIPVAQAKNNNVRVEDVVNNVEHSEAKLAAESSVQQSSINAEEKIITKSQENLVEKVVEKKENLKSDDSKAALKQDNPVILEPPEYVKFEAAEKKSSEDFDIKYEEPSREQSVTESVKRIETEPLVEPEKKLEEPALKQEPVRQAAEQVKETQDIVITYNNEDVYADKNSSTGVESEKKEPVQSDLSIRKEAAETPESVLIAENNAEKKELTVQPQSSNTSQQKTDIPQEVVPVLKDSDNNSISEKPVSKIIEKHAQINPEEFDFIHKPAPEISEEDEVVVLEPKHFMSEAEKHMAAESYNKQNSLTEKIATINQETSVKTNENSAISKEKTSLNAAPEKTDKIVKGDRIQEPVLVVPNISAPAGNESNVVKETSENSIIAQTVDILPAEASNLSENSSIQDDEEVINQILDSVPEKTQNIVSEDNSNLIDPPDKKSAKVKKEKVKREKIKEEKEQPKVKKEKPVKEKKQKTIKPGIAETVTVGAVVAETAMTSDISPIPEVKSKQKKSKSKPETTISSIVQSAFVGDDDIVVNTTPELNGTKDKKISQKNEKTVKQKKNKIKSKNNTNVDAGKSVVAKTDETSVSSDEKTPKFSWFDKFKKVKQEENNAELNSQTKSDGNLLSETPHKTRKSIFKKSEKVKNQADTKVSEFVDTVHPEVDLANTADNGKKKSSLSGKRMFKKISTTDIGEKDIQQESTSIKEETKKVKQKLEKSEVLTKDVSVEETKPVEIPGVRTEKASVEDVVPENTETGNNAAAPKEKKKFSWWRSKKDKSQDNEIKSKFSFKNLFSKTSGDKSEIYVKDNNEKKVIKQIAK